MQTTKTTNYRRPTKVRFEEKFRYTPGCWIWTGEKNPKGYGRLTVRRAGKGVSVMAHRLSYELYVGVIPKGMLVCHKCDHPSCVNPDHLWLGTDKDNSDDKISKGRARVKPRPGDKHHAAKLSDEQVYLIRADPRSVVELAKEFGISRPQVAAIKNRTRWGHLPTRGDERPSPDGRAGKAKILTVEQQQQIFNDKRPQKIIAAEFGVSQSLVSSLKRGDGCYAGLKNSEQGRSQAVHGEAPGGKRTAAESGASTRNVGLAPNRS